MTSVDQLNDAVHAIRQQAAVMRLRDWQLLQIQGRDHVGFLHRVLTADVKKLAVGTGTPAALLTPKGRVVCLMRLYRPDDGRILACVETVDAERLCGKLAQYAVMDDVDITVLPCHGTGVYGPRWADCATLGQLPALAPYACHRTRVLDVEAWVMGDDNLAVPGVMFWSDKDVGLDQPVVSESAYEICRIEAGVPRMHRELSEEILILEAGLLAAVSFTKGCYIGQEPVCRVHSRGQVAHLLRGVVLDGDVVPALGTRLMADAKEDAGEITSATWSPTMQKVIGLCYLHRSVADMGTEVRVTSTSQRGQVVLLPHVQTDIVPQLCPRF